MENEKIEKELKETEPLKQSSPGFNMGQIVLVIGVVIAIILAGWNMVSIMETDKKMNAEDDDLSSEIEAVDNSLKISIDNLDNETDGRINTLSNEISDVDDRLTQEKEYLIDMIESLNSTLQSEITILQNKNSVLEENISLLEANIITLEENISILGESITQINNDIDSMQTYIQSLQNQVDSLENQVDNLINPVTPTGALSFTENTVGNYTGGIISLSDTVKVDDAWIKIIDVSDSSSAIQYPLNSGTPLTTTGGLTIKYTDTNGNGEIDAGDVWTVSGGASGDIIKLNYIPTGGAICEYTLQ